MDMDYSSDEAPASSNMLPPVGPSKRLGACRYSKDEWNVQRPVIEGMYPLKGMTLRGIAEFLKEERGFAATERQLKRKINDWQLDKNVKGIEMRAIVHKQQRRKAEGKKTIFRVRGQPVEQSKIDRWQKRSGNVDSSVVLNGPANSPVPSSPTLSVISYNTLSAHGTPSPKPPHTGLRVTMDSVMFGGTPRSVTMMRQWSPAPPISLNQHTNQQMFVESTSRGLLNFVDVDETGVRRQSASPLTASAPMFFSNTSMPGGIQSNSYAYNVDNYVDTHTGLNALTPSSFQPALRGLIVPISSSGMTLTMRPFSQEREEEHRQRLKMLQSKFGLYHPAVLHTLHRLVGILEDQGRYAAAETFLQQEAEATQKIAGDDDPATLLAFSRLSYFFYLQGKWRSAETLSKRVHEKAVRVLPITHPVLWYIKENYAASLHAQYKYQEASNLCREVIRVAGSILPPDDSKLLSSMEKFAIVLKDKDEFDESEGILRQVVQSRQLCEGLEHINTIQSLSYLGEVLCLQKSYAEASAVLEEVFIKRVRVLGPEHPRTLETQGWLGIVKGKLEKYQESEEMLQYVLEKSKKVFKNQHIYAVRWAVKLMGVFEAQRRHEDAEKVGSATLREFVPPDMPDDLDTSWLKAALGGIHYRQGRFQEARAMLLEAASGYTNMLGSKHSRAKQAWSDYMSIIEMIELSEKAEHAQPRALPG